METVPFFRLNNTVAGCGMFPVHVKSTQFWVASGMGYQHTQTEEVVILFASFAAIEVGSPRHILVRTFPLQRVLACQDLGNKVMKWWKAPHSPVS